MDRRAIKKNADINTSFLFQQPGPSKCLLVSVIVPVRNEAEHLTKTLDALRLQQDVGGFPLNPRIYEVLLLANNCSDNSFRVAQQYKLRYPFFKFYVAEVCFPTKIANIGTARRLLMDEACQRLLSIGKSNGIIASTDGDSEVDPSWIFHIIEEIKKGTDAVGGRIVTKHLKDTPGGYYAENEQYRNLVARAESKVDPLEHDPWPRHFQYFGANLAVTCEMYLRVGGLPQLPFLEDEAFHQALVRNDARIRKSLKVKVTTSDRKEGRVEIGFSQQLREWSDMEKVNKPQLVASAEELITKFKNRQRLRNCWLAFVDSGMYDRREVQSIASDLYIKYEWLERELIDSSYFGKLWEAVEVGMNAGSWGRKWKPVLISKAIAGLRKFTGIVEVDM
jgi:glycosyltransferase involved in cell wall biosynthesis